VASNPEVSKAAQTIMFSPLPNVTYGALPIALTATASSGLAVSYTVAGPATVSGSTLTITGVGNVTVTASQAGNSNFAAAISVPQTFAVSPAALTVTANNQSRPFGQANPTLTFAITGFVNGDAQSVVTGAPTLSTTATTGSTAGTYPITVAAGTLAAANYTFKFVNGTLTVTGGAGQTITFGQLPNVTYGVAPITLTATASSGLAVSYTVTGPATVAGSTLTITGAGIVTATALQQGNSNFAAAAPVPQTFTVATAVLTVTANNQSRLSGQPNPPLTYAITGFVNGDTQSVVSGTPTLSTTATTGSAAGTYPITITVGTLTATNYTFTFVNGTLTVTGGAAQTITFAPLPNVTYGVAPITLTATASSGLPVSYAATGSATVSGSTLTITGAGIVTVTASQAGNASFAAATPVPQTFTVAPEAQTITFGTLPGVTYGVAPIALTATASSGLAVSYSVTGPASVAGSTLTITGAGSVTVTASQVGNTNFTAATPVPQTFTAATAVLTVTANNLSVAAGLPIPTLTYAITGFVNGDTQVVVSGTPVLTTLANTGSSPGTYTITVTAGTLAAANYTFTFVNGTLTLTSSSGNTYITSFSSPPAPENPISEGGNWINGGTIGVDWGNVQTAPGLAFGTNVSGAPPYNDSTAVLAGTWGPNQAVCATVHTVNQTSSFQEEVELRTNTSITAHNITGYEFDVAARNSSNSPYMVIVRWNGPLNNFTFLTSTISGPGINNGDSLCASSSSGTLNLYVNGVLQLTGTDNTYTNGSPGIGFWNLGGNVSDDASYGFSDFSATDTNLSSLVPAVSGVRSASVVAPAPGTQPLTAALAPAVGLSSASLAFGTEYVGDTNTAPLVTLSNTGATGLSVNSIAVAGPNAGDFAVTNTCGVLAVGGNCAISVTFTPSLTTSETAILTITDNAPASPQTITLTGSGMTSAGQFMVLSADKTHLVNTFTDSPVFISGEQAYSLATNVSNNSDIEQYLSTRQSMGFNLVSVRAADIANLVNYPDNALGQPPFNGAAFTSMNEGYWEHLDFIIQRAAAHGITVLLAPAFVGGGSSGCTEATGWCPDLLATSDANLAAYGAYLGNRYKSYPNIIWMLGGDNDLIDFPAMKAKIQDIANGIASVDSVHLMMIENQCPYCSSQDDWPAGPWNINFLYHAASGMAAAANADYLRSDYLPTFVGHDTLEGITSAPSDVAERTEAYQAVLGGANLGSVFGNCVVSFFGYDSPSCSTWSSDTQWQVWLDTIGATGRMHLGNLMRSREFWKMVPDTNHAVATSGFGSGDTVTATSRSSDGQTIIAYIPNGNALTVNMSEITSASNTANCEWFNPRNGSTTPIGTFANSGTQIFTPPDSNDWVLVVDDASAALPAPGSTN
jgi:hypothetical protein